MLELPGGAQSGGLSTTQSSRHRRVALLLATAYLSRYPSDSYTCATLGSNSFSGKSCTGGCPSRKVTLPRQKVLNMGYAVDDSSSRCGRVIPKATALTRIDPPALRKN